MPVSTIFEGLILSTSSAKEETISAQSMRIRYTYMYYIITIGLLPCNIQLYNYDNIIIYERYRNKNYDYNNNSIW